MTWRTCCPACRSEIDVRSTRCRYCCIDLERVPAGLVGAVVGAISAVVGVVQGVVTGVVLGAIIEMISGVPHLAVLLGGVLAVAFALDKFWIGSTRFRVRHPDIHLNTVNIAREIKIVDLRHG